jgi:hypothetical protein
VQKRAAGRGCGCEGEAGEPASKMGSAARSSRPVAGIMMG